ESFGIATYSRSRVCNASAPQSLYRFCAKSSDLIVRQVGIQVNTLDLSANAAMPVGRKSAKVRTRVIILAALAAFLVWEVVTRGVAAYLAEVSPEMAIYFRPSESTALLNLAEKKLGELNIQKKKELMENPREPNSNALTKEASSQQSFDTKQHPSPSPN